LLNNSRNWFPGDKVTGFGADSFLAGFVVWNLVTLEAAFCFVGGAGIAAGYHGDKTPLWKDYGKFLSFTVLPCSMFWSAWASCCLVVWLMSNSMVNNQANMKHFILWNMGNIGLLPRWVVKFVRHNMSPAIVRKIKLKMYCYLT